MHPKKLFDAPQLTLREELDRLEQSSSSACDCPIKQQLRRKLEEAISQIDQITYQKNRLESDLRSAKKNIEGKEASLVRAHEEIRVTKETADRAHQSAEEYRYEVERVREEHRNYVIENAYLRQKEVEDETPRLVLSMMRSGKKRLPLSFPLSEDHPHYPRLYKKPRFDLQH